MHTKFTLFIASVLSILCAFSSLNASAVSLSEEVQFQESIVSPYFRITFSNNADSGWINAFYTNGNTPQNITNFYIRNASNAKPSSLSNGRYVTFNLRARFKGVSDKWNTSGAWSINSSSVSCPIIDVTNGDSQYHDLNNLTYTYENLFVTCKYTGSGDINTNLTILSSQYTTDWQIRVMNVAIWSRESSASSEDIEAVTSAVNSMKTAINNKLDTTNNKLDTLNISINDLKSAQEQANQDAQDRYDQEKQEEQDREQQGNADSSQMQGTFNFSVLNPFSGLFGLFSSSCSVNIPIIAGWIHSPSSTYSSWWCQNSTMSNIKDTLTPVFGMASMMLLFGFVIRWLSNNSGDIYGARNMNKGLNG